MILIIISNALVISILELLKGNGLFISLCTLYLVTDNQLIMNSTRSGFDWQPQHRCFDGNYDTWKYASLRLWGEVKNSRLLLTID